MKQKDSIKHPPLTPNLTLCSVLGLKQNQLCARKSLQRIEKVSRDIYGLTLPLKSIRI